MTTDGATTGHRPAIGLPPRPAGRPRSLAADRALRAERRGRILLAMVAALLAASAAAKLAPAFHRLVFRDVASLGAVDLRLRWAETLAWFRGFHVRGNVYPPASFVVFWPVMGWLSLDATRRLWVFLYLASLVWLGRTCMRESGATTGPGRIAAALLPAALTGTAVVVTIGQLVLLLMPAMISFALLLARGRRTLARDLGAAALFVVAAAKPTLTLPFAGLLVALPRRLRPGLAATALYLALTVFALSFITSWGPRTTASTGVTRMVESSTSRIQEFTAKEYPAQVEAGHFKQGYGNLQNASSTAGLSTAQSFVLPALSVLLCCAWTWRRRHADPWILLGVCGLAARLGWYHRLYDDVLMLPAIIALARIAASRPRLSPTGADDTRSLLARLLLVACAVAGCIPGTMLTLVPAIHGAIVLTWLASLWFLVRYAAHPDAMDLGPGPQPRPTPAG